ncbi:MAG: T9SS type A sorting domain-containing protein [Ferruginibacter sp.]
MKQKIRTKLNLWFNLLLLFSLSYTTGNAQIFEWTKAVGGANRSTGKDIVVDSLGNIYTIGEFIYSPFTGPADFDPGPGTYNFTESGSFVLKLDKHGNFVWARNFDGVQGGTSNKSITIDRDGNLVLAGIIGGTVDVDPGPGTFLITTNSVIDFLVVKLTADGNFLWAKSMPCDHYNDVYDLTTDVQNNILLCGYFIGEVDMDPGPGVYSLGPAVSSNAFILKLNNNGDFLWAKTLYDLTGSGAGAIRTSNTGDVYVCGGFYNTIFDQLSGTVINSQGQADGFILKLTANGDFVWVRTFGGNDNDGAIAIAIGKDDMIYSTGNFNNTCLFSDGINTFSLTSAGYDDACISKFSPDGDYLWVKQIGNADLTLGDAFNDITLDTAGNIYCMGLFKDSLDADPGPAVNMIASEGDQSTYVLKLGNSGNFKSVGVAKGISYVFGRSLAVDNENNILFTGRYVAGWATGTGIDFDPGPGVYPLFSLAGTAGGNETSFITKWSQLNIVVPLTLLYIEGANKNTYNLVQWKTASEVNTNNFIVQRSVDGIQFYDIADVAAKGYNNNSYEFADLNIANSSFFYYRLKMRNNDGSFTFSKTIFIQIDTKQISFSITPNPAQDLVTINFHTPLPNTEVNIYNTLGSMVMSRSYKIAANSIRINTRQLSSGVYFVKVNAGGKVYQQQLVISK